MHYGNGREAKNGDKVVFMGYDGQCALPRSGEIMKDFAGDVRAEIREAAREPMPFAVWINTLSVRPTLFEAFEAGRLANSPAGGRDGVVDSMITNEMSDLTTGVDQKQPSTSTSALASGVTEPGMLEQQAWNLYYDRHAKVAEEIVESLIIFAAPLRERVAELERELESIADFANGEGDVGNIIARRARAALSPDSQDGKKGNE